MSFVIPSSMRQYANMLSNGVTRMYITWRLFPKDIVMIRCVVPLFYFLHIRFQMSNSRIPFFLYNQANLYFKFHMHRLG